MELDCPQIFGMRKHPISGYNKMHKGVDFAASTGTPIYTGGNGVIEFAGKNGGYGNYIRIRHNNEYKTAYAHLSRFKKGISKGVRVTSGRSDRICWQYWKFNRTTFTL